MIRCVFVCVSVVHVCVFKYAVRESVLGQDSDMLIAGVRCGANASHHTRRATHLLSQNQHPIRTDYGARVDL